MSEDKRKLLTENYVDPQIPRILNTVPIHKYFNLISQAYNSIRDPLYHKRSLEERYIIVRKIVVLAVQKLPKHNAFDMVANTKEKFKCIEIGKKCMTELEAIVRELDDVERKRAEEIREMELINIFEDDLECAQEESKVGTIDTSSFYPNQPSLSWSSALRILGPQTNHDQKVVFKLPSTESTDLPGVSQCSVSDTKLIPGVTVNDDLLIIQKLGPLTGFQIPVPNRSLYTLKLGNGSLQFIRDDFHISFAPFIKNLPPELQVCDAAIETNRCFFLHLGVALSLHPYALQAIFRRIAGRILQGCCTEFEKIVLPTVLEYAGYVDANSLSYLWCNELSQCRICIISGSQYSPIFTCFADSDKVHSLFYHIIIVHSSNQVHTFTKI